jgi:hypothetical protein
VLNFTPGLLAGLLLRWKPLAAVLLGGVTYVSSSGLIAKLVLRQNVICAKNRPIFPATLPIGTRLEPENLAQKPLHFPLGIRGQIQPVRGGRFRAESSRKNTWVKQPARNDDAIHPVVHVRRPDRSTRIATFRRVFPCPARDAFGLRGSSGHIQTAVASDGFRSLQ